MREHSFAPLTCRASQEMNQDIHEAFQGLGSDEPTCMGDRDHSLRDGLLLLTEEPKQALDGEP